MKLHNYKQKFEFFRPQLRWEHLIIAFLIGAVWSPRSPGKILSTTPSNVIYASTSIKPLPTLKQVIQQPQKSLDVVWVDKRRPTGTYGNSYTAGNCTWYVASRLMIPNSWGNANNWSYSALLAGYSEGTSPKVGSIAQTSGDSGLGHVAIVESINPDGSFVVSEMNFKGLGVVDTRTTTTIEFPNFIYI